MHLFVMCSAKGANKWWIWSRSYSMLFGIIICQNHLLQAQFTQPINGVSDAKKAVYAFEDATIQIAPGKRMMHATLVIRQGKIEAVGTKVVVPADAIRISCSGKYIYPSFLDVYAQYGLPPVEKHHGGRPQYNSLRQGPYSWNEAIRADFESSHHLVAQPEKAEEYRKNGFGYVLTHRMDGIARGTGSLVNVAAKNWQEEVVANDVSNHYSFDKGSSGQEYPTSYMGSVALLRQLFIDKDWYKTQTTKKEYHKEWEVLLKYDKNPIFFEVYNARSALKAIEICKENNQDRIIIKGIGDEYQKLEELKKHSAVFVLPLHFPQAFDTEDKLDESILTYPVLKHWEMAPLNASMLCKAQLPICITSHGLKDPTQFLTQLRKAIRAGLSEENALKALTLTPASILGVHKLLGTLEQGKHASFIIMSDSLASKGGLILENWIQGNPFVINKSPWIDPRGIYSLYWKDSSRADTITMSITGKSAAELEIEWMKDTVKRKLSASISLNHLQIRGEWNKKSIEMHAWLEGSSLTGVSISSKYPNIKATKEMNYVPAALSDSAKIAETKKLKSEDSVLRTVLPVPYPFQTFGLDSGAKTVSVLIRNATLWTSDEVGTLAGYDIWLKDGKIAGIGKNLQVKAEVVMDGTGKHVTPGLVDEHSHIAIMGGVNECSHAVTAEVRIADAINDEDVNIYRNLSGGVTSAQLLHGSCNVIGGQSAIIKLRWGKPGAQLLQAGAPGFIKCALGENVKQSNFGDQYVIRYPQTRMGVEQVFINAFENAKAYQKNLSAQGRRDLQLEAVLEILESRRYISCHSYVQSEILMLMEVAQRYGFRVNTFTHILEGYKVANEMVKHGAAGSTFSDWWAYKYEVKDAIPFNAALMHKAGVLTAINSDDPEMARRLNHEAAKAIKYGGVSEIDALKMITIHPAKILHIDSHTGSLRVGKDADVVLWSGHPLSVYSRVEGTWVDGQKLYDPLQEKALLRRRSDEMQVIFKKMELAKKAGESVRKPLYTHQQVIWHCEDSYNDLQMNHRGE